jgi:hypothetical protein
MARKTDILHEDLCTFMIISHRSHFRMRNISDECGRENRNTHFILNTYFPKITPSVSLCGKTGTARHARWDNIIWCMRFTCGVRKVRIETHTLITLNSYCFPIATIVTRTRPNVTFIVRCISCLLW